MGQATLIASGNILVSSFVKISGDNTCAQATAGTDKLFGISAEFSNTAPIAGADTTKAAAAGESLLVYQPGDICMLQAGTGGWNAGELLTATSAGLGIAASSGNYYGAVALHDVSGSGFGTVSVRFGQLN